MPSTPQPVSGHVFISYARDGGAGEAWAQRFEQRLHDWSVPVFRDISDMEPGEEWLARLPEGLERARAVLLVVSRATRGRRWVNRELAYADERGIRVIPAVVESDAELPFAVQTTVHLDFVAAPDRSWQALRETLIRLLAVGVVQVCSRGEELAYLDELCAQQAVVQSAARVFEPLAGAQQSSARLDVVAEACMPVSFRFERLRAEPMARPELRDSRPVDDVRDVLHQPQRMALLGEPGAGKTFSLGRIASELAERCRRDENAPLPVLVPLGQWIEPAADRTRGCGITSASTWACSGRASKSSRSGTAWPCCWTASTSCPPTSGRTRPLQSGA